MNKIRLAKEEDAPVILELICELAAFEKAENKVSLTVDDLIRDGLRPNPHPLFSSLIIESDEEIAGFALFYNRYSTWKGKSLYLEDLYVRPSFRRKGLGAQVMSFLVKKAQETNCRRFEWQVLDWNEKGIHFYKNFGAEIDKEWFNCRIEGEKLKNFTL